VLAAGASAAQAQTATNSPVKSITLELGNSTKMDFVLIPAGTFMMGAEDSRADEKPVTKVTITRPFYFGKYEVTQAQWQAVMGSNPSYYKGTNLPVEQVSWNAAQGFLTNLNERAATASACPPRRNGNTPAAQTPPRNTALATAALRCRNTAGSPATANARPVRWVGEKKPNPWACMIFTATFGNGARTGMRRIPAARWLLE
jgi:hypothetical protein